MHSLPNSLNQTPLVLFASPALLGRQDVSFVRLMTQSGHKDAHECVLAEVSTAEAVLQLLINIININNRRAFKCLNSSVYSMFFLFVR